MTKPDHEPGMASGQRGCAVSLATHAEAVPGEGVPGTGRVSSGAPSGGPTVTERRSRVARVLLFALLVFVVAAVPRLLHRDLFPTSDEDSWMRRAGGFTYGLVNGQLGRTYQNGHPGVTTMWIATLAQGPDGALRFADRVHGLRFVGQVPGYLEGLAQARIGFALLGALAAAATALLVGRLFGAGPALLAGLALALEPFLVANSQLVHVDGPLTAFMPLAALATIVRWQVGGGRGYLLASAVASGLALLSKTPSLFLVGFVPLTALACVLSPVRSERSTEGTGGEASRGGEASFDRPRSNRGSRTIGIRRVVLDLAIWGTLALATFGALWPALWALGPGEVLGRIVDFTRETGGQPDEVGSFFLGQVGADPGPLYYPIATLFRLSPFTTFGLLSFVALIWRRPAGERRSAGWLVVYALGFALMMTFGPKKFDRYLLPIFPVLVALAALGWWAMLERLHAMPLRLTAGVGLAALAVWPLVAVAPYPLAYYNPLLGGGPAAARTVMVGNGEGLDQAARWLAAQPDVQNLRVASHSFDILTALVRTDGEPLRDGIPNDADYIVTYGRRIQMRRWGSSLDRYLTTHPPVYSVWINGIEYVRIHPGPKRTGDS